MNSIRKLLQEYVKLLIERAADVSDKALGIYPGEGGQMIVIWDPAAMIESLSSGKGETAKEKIQRSSTNWIMGMMTIASPKSDHWRGWEVKASAAQRGFGPGIYDIAMSLFGAIYSDRSSVSGSARRVWDYYKIQRPDIKKLPFDDKNIQKTSPTLDDGDVFPGGGDNPLNYAYKGAKMSTGSMRNKHNTAIAEIGKLSRISPADLNGLIVEAAEEFFASKYS